VDKKKPKYRLYYKYDLTQKDVDDFLKSLWPYIADCLYKNDLDNNRFILAIRNDIF